MFENSRSKKTQLFYQFSCILSVVIFQFNLLDPCGSGSTALFCSEQIVGHLPGPNSVVKCSPLFLRWSSPPPWSRWSRTVPPASQLSGCCTHKPQDRRLCSREQPSTFCLEIFASFWFAFPVFQARIRTYSMVFLIIIRIQNRDSGSWKTDDKIAINA